MKRIKVAEFDATVGEQDNGIQFITWEGSWEQADMLRGCEVFVEVFVIEDELKYLQCLVDIHEDS